MASQTSSEIFFHTWKIASITYNKFNSVCRQSVATTLYCPNVSWLLWSIRVKKIISSYIVITTSSKLDSADLQRSIYICVEPSKRRTHFQSKVRTRLLVSGLSILLICFKLFLRLHRHKECRICRVNFSLRWPYRPEITLKIGRTPLVS